MMPRDLLLIVVLLCVSGVGRCAPPNILSQIIADLKQNYRGQLSDLHADFNRRDAQPETQRHNVAFYAERSTYNTNRGTSQTIVYDVVPINSGNGYNRNAGIFTAPTSGTYVVTWTNGITDTRLVVNNEELEQTSPSAFLGNARLGGVRSVELNLNEGDVVCIKTAVTKSGHMEEKELLTFADWLLR